MESGSILRIVPRLSPYFYRLGQLAGRFTFFCTMNLHMIRHRIVEREGPFVLAVSHMGHLEPCLVGTVVRRPIDYISRIEFYRYRISAWILHKLNAIKVNRQGVAANTIRTALDRLRQGRIVGIFPEGGVCRGAASVCLGGPIKLGATLIANRAGVPIIPCVLVGTPQLSRVQPWLPYKRAYVWIAFGEPIPPQDLGSTRQSRKAACAAMGQALQSSMMSLYQELCDTYGLCDMAGETFAEKATASDPFRRPAVPAPEPTQSAA